MSEHYEPEILCHEAQLRRIERWLKHHLAAHRESRHTGLGGHDGDGSSWAVCAIPD